jgi:hypothetical protein
VAEGAHIGLAVLAISNLPRHGIEAGDDPEPTVARRTAAGQRFCAYPNGCGSRCSTCRSSRWAVAASGCSGGKSRFAAAARLHT